MDDTELRLRAESIAEHFRERRRILFITGAGLSAESGLPTYRGIGGLYAKAETEHDMPIEVALSGTVFYQRPEITWHYIARLEKAVRNAKPNRGHEIIAELESKHEVVVLTQNVDGFHRAAGSSRVIDIHGDCHYLVCTRCGHREIRADYSGLELPPKCQECGSLVRPEIVLFEELLPPDKVDELGRELARGFDAYFTIGTTSVFPYIAQPIVDAARSGKLSVEINPEPTEVSEIVDIALRTGAVRALRAIFEANNQVTN
jgi:NAD-dependent deacetylase